MDILIRIFLLLVVFQIRSTQHKGNNFFIGYANKTWFEYFEDCDLESFPPNNIASRGWAAGIYLNTNWMAFEGCYDVLFYGGMMLTPFNSSIDAQTACSNICKHNLLFAYKESRCFCYENHGMNQHKTTNKCNRECKCGNKAYYTVYRHFLGRQRPQGDRDQNFTCSATITGFGSNLFAVNCDSCRKKEYLKTGLNNLYCLFIDNSNEQYNLRELPCNKRTQSHCEIKHSGASDDKMSTEKVKTTQIDFTTSMMSTTEKDPMSVGSIVETTSAILQMDEISATVLVEPTYETETTAYITYSNKASTSTDNSALTSKDPIGSILSSKGSSEDEMTSKQVKSTHTDIPTLIGRTTEEDLRSRVTTGETTVSVVTFQHVWIWFVTSVGCLVILMVGVFGLVLNVIKQGYGSVGRHGRGTSRIYLAAPEDKNYLRVYNTTAAFDNNTDPLANEERNQYEEISDPLYAYTGPSIMQTNAGETSTADPQHTYDEPCPIQASDEEGGMADLAWSYEEPSPIQTNAEKGDMIYLAGSYEEPCLIQRNAWEGDTLNQQEHTKTQ